MAKSGARPTPTTLGRFGISVAMEGVTVAIASREQLEAGAMDMFYRDAGGTGDGVANQDRWIL
jgi:hypothetical protein